ncbi:MAG: hypothetical protein ABFD77_10875 [Thermotogota bacterium]
MNAGETGRTMNEAVVQAAYPYVGPRAFDEGEESLFFGRTREIAALRALITAHRVVLLYAESGAGKTSLLQAGLVPNLRREGFEVFPPARVGATLPDLSPPQRENIFVRNALLQWLLLGELEPRSETTVADFLAVRPHLTDADGLPEPRLLLFDQFEELFVNYPSRWKDREGFFVQVQEALSRDPLLRVLFVVREDFVASFVPYEPLFDDRLRNRFRLERLRRDAALAAVRMPLAATERSFAPGAAEELIRKLSLIRFEDEGRVDFVEGEFVEPVQLQVVCQQLWDSLPPSVSEISRFHVATVGDPRVVLARYYEAALRRVGKKTRTREAALRRLFGRHLITSTGTRGTMHVEARRTAGVPNEAIASLEAERIIRSERRAGARWIEIPHDSLVEPIRQSNARWASRRRWRLALAGGGLVVALAVTSVVLLVTRHAQQLELGNAKIALAASRLDVVSARLASPSTPDTWYEVFDTEFVNALPNVALGYATAAGLECQQQSASRTTTGYREFVTLRSLAIKGNDAERRAAGIALIGPLSQWGWIPKWLEEIASDRSASAELRRAAVPPLANQWSRQKKPDELYLLATNPTRTKEIRSAAARAYYCVLQTKYDEKSFHAMCEKDARLQSEPELQWVAGEYLASDYADVTPSTLETWAKRGATAGLRRAAALAFSAWLVRTAWSYGDVLPSLLDLSPQDSAEYREVIISTFAELYLRDNSTSIGAQLERALARAGMSDSP